MNENTVKRENLEVSKLYWLLDVSDYTKCPTSTLVKVIDTSKDPFYNGQTKVVVRNVLTNAISTVPYTYTEFEQVHPMYLPNVMKALRADQERIARELAIYESLV